MGCRPCIFINGRQTIGEVVVDINEPLLEPPTCGQCVFQQHRYSKERVTENIMDSSTKILGTKGSEGNPYWSRTIIFDAPETSAKVKEIIDIKNKELHENVGKLDKRCDGILKDCPLPDNGSKLASKDSGDDYAADVQPSKCKLSILRKENTVTNPKESTFPRTTEL